MTERILIANRGECARGIAFTCNKLGITPVVVYTPDDEDSLHVRDVQEKYEISSYTNIPSMIKAAKKLGAEMIHPGWGFLSENQKFPRACDKAGIIFVGPSEKTMGQAGNKEKIKRIATNLGVPVITSTPSSLRLSRLPGWARKNGLSNEDNSTPMMLKAATAGGGNGNQVVSNIQELDKAIETVKRRAKNLGGSSKRVFMERFLPEVRHVEVQVLGDQHGKLVHLGTRDCSVQYNQQKVIEEAPAPFLTPEQEELLYEYALGIARAIEYSNAGTVEFLLALNGEIFFMEFNPRLQVEHGVTELITGLDLVEQQIRIAEGEHLAFGQEDIKLGGVAIEARINAQTIYPADPKKLVASDGVVEEVIFPEGKGIRVDHSLHNGYKINLNYNPTQAKVMVWSSSRGKAIDKLHEALGQVVIKGVETNIPLIIEALSHHKFVEGEHTTEFFGELLKELAEKEGEDYHNKETAANIGVSIALALQDMQSRMPQSAASWKIAGRIAQMGQRGSASRGWRR